MGVLYINFPDQPCLAWAVAWLCASRNPGQELIVRERTPAEIHPQLIPVGSRLFRPDANPPEVLEAFCNDHQVPFEACGQLVIGHHEDTARLLDLFQSASRRGLNVLNLPPDGLRNRYPHLGFKPGTRGMLDMEAARVDAAALCTALRSRAMELGARPHRGTAPRHATVLRPASAPIRLIGRWRHRYRPVEFPCLLSGLPEPDLPEYTPTLSGPQVEVRPRWRRLSPGRKARLRHEGPWQRFQNLLPQDIQQAFLPEPGIRYALAPLPPPRIVQADATGSPLPFDITPNGQVTGAHPEPMDLFHIAACLADEVSTPDAPR